MCGGGGRAAYIHRIVPTPPTQCCCQTGSGANKLFVGLQSNANAAGELTCVMVDELHMVCDPHRGLPLELSITKLLFSRYADRIQLIGMSATMGGEQVSCHGQQACPHSALLCPALPCCPAHACPALSLPLLLLSPASPCPDVAFLILPCLALQCPYPPRPVLPCPGPPGSASHSTSNA